MGEERAAAHAFERRQHFRGDRQAQSLGTTRYRRRRCLHGITGGGSGIDDAPDGRFRRRQGTRGIRDSGRVYADGDDRPRLSNLARDPGRRNQGKGIEAARSQSGVRVLFRGRLGQIIQGMRVEDRGRTDRSASSQFLVPRLSSLMFETYVHKLFWPYLLGGLIALMSISNPLSKIPLFVSLTEEMTDEERALIARKASLYGFAMLTFTLFFGVFILEAFGISSGALRIAGGLTIALVGYRMLFGHGYVGVSSTGVRRNIAVFPLAFPAISGPGAIAVMIGISTEIAELKAAINQSIAYAATVASISITCVVIWLTYRWARAISMVMGPDAMEAVTRLMGFLLVCIGVQFVASGVRSFIAGQ